MFGLNGVPAFIQIGGTCYFERQVRPVLRSGPDDAKNQTWDLGRQVDRKRACHQLDFDARQAVKSIALGYRLLSVSVSGMETLPPREDWAILPIESAWTSLVKNTRASGPRT